LAPSALTKRRVVDLCSEAASFVTCSELVIDGGFTAI